MNQESPLARLKAAAISRPALHLYFWLALVLGALLVTGIEAVPSQITRNFMLAWVALQLPPVYLHFLAYNRLFDRRRIWRYLMATAGVIAFFGWANFIVLSSVFGDTNGPFTKMFNVGFVLVITTALRTIRRAGLQRLRLQEIQTQHLATELALLKSQIHPHFLFNTLNNLYSMALRSDRGTAQGIADLAHLMRYQIDDCREDTIALPREIEQIERYLDLQRLRFSPDDDLEIRFEVDGRPEAVQVAPMLLIPLVENAFKHGISLQEKSFIRIRMVIGATSLRFSVCNSNHSHRLENARPRTVGFGIGSENIRRRLQLLYPGEHRFSEQETAEHYLVELELSVS